MRKIYLFLILGVFVSGCSDEKGALSGLLEGRTEETKATVSSQYYTYPDDVQEDTNPAPPEILPPPEPTEYKIACDLMSGLGTSSTYSRALALVDDDYLAAYDESAELAGVGDIKRKVRDAVERLGKCEMTTLNPEMENKTSSIAHIYPSLGKQQSVAEVSGSVKFSIECTETRIDFDDVIRNLGEGCSAE